MREREREHRLNQHIQLPSKLEFVRQPSPWRIRLPEIVAASGHACDLEIILQVTETEQSNDPVMPCTFYITRVTLWLDTLC